MHLPRASLCETITRTRIAFGQHAVALQSQRHHQAIVVLSQRGGRRVVFADQLAQRLLFLDGDRAHGSVLVGGPLGGERLAIALRLDERGLLFGAVLIGQAVAVCDARARADCVGRGQSQTMGVKIIGGGQYLCTDESRPNKQLVLVAIY